MSKDIESLSFEHAYQELEALVERMELGQQSLEESLTDFERGVSLMKRCQSLLQNAEQQVEVLMKDSDGLLQSKPLAADESDTELS